MYYDTEFLIIWNSVISINIFFGKNCKILKITDAYPAYPQHGPCAWLARVKNDSFLRQPKVWEWIEPKVRSTAYYVRIFSRARKTTGLKNPFFSSVAWPLLTRFRQKGPSKSYVLKTKGLLVQNFNGMEQFTKLSLSRFSMIKTFSRHFSCSRELRKQVKNTRKKLFYDRMTYI